MNIITVPGQSGRAYNVRIAGSAPTPEEQSRIDSFVAQQEASDAALVQRYFGQTPAAEAQPQGGLGTAVGVGVDTLQQSYGSTLEGIGSLTGVQGLENYGRGVAEANAKEASEKAQALTGRDDVDSFGSAMSFVGETLAQQLPQLGVSLGGAAAGATAGSVFGPVGTAIGGIVGGLAANMPFFYGQNRERQKEAIDLGLRTEMDEGAAFLAAIPQATLDAVVDRFMIGKVLNPEFIRAGGLLTRGVKGAGAGVVAEVPTEVGQAIIERYQAGLPIDSEDAIREYEDVAIAAGIVGGTVSGTVNVASGDIRKKREKEAEKEAFAQLAEDQDESEADTINRLKFGLAAADKEAQEETLGAPPLLALPKPSRLNPQQEVEAFMAASKGKADGLKAGDIVPTSQRTFDLDQYDTAVEKVIASGKFSMPAIQSAVAKKTKAKVPMSVARDIRDEMVRRGVIRADTQSASGFVVEPKREEKFSEAESLRKTMDQLDRAIETDRKAREQALQETRRLDQTGAKRGDVRAMALKAEQAEARISQSEKVRADVERRIANVDQSGVVPTTERPRSLLQDGKVVAPIAGVSPESQQAGVNNQVENLQTSLANYNSRIKEQRAILNRLKAEAKKVQLPKSDLDKMSAIQKGIDADTFAANAIRDRMRNPSADIQIAQEQARANEARTAADQAARARRAPIYSGQEQRVFNALRKRLTNLGLSDVNLTAEKIIRPDLARQNSLIEGSFDQQDANRVIALSLGIYDPSLTDQQLFDVLSGVMNHEVIHALRNLGLFTDAEWRSLSELARRQKYMKVKSGKAVERAYTYFQRARQMYPDASEDIQVEEAVAEMFRDHVDGKLKVGGKPKTLMDRIKAFFRSIWQAHGDAEIDPNAVFEGVRFGRIGARDRKPVIEPQEERLSRLRVEPLPPGVATEEEARAPKDIVMPIDPTVPEDQVRGQIKALTRDNVELVKDMISTIDRKFRTKSGDNIKDLAKVTQKARRPSILAKKPWHTVAHIRDSYRFKTVIDDFRDVPGIFQELLDTGVGLVKIDTNKLFEPGQWGWRIIAFDLRMPNGQLVEWYLPIKELEAEKKASGHLIFEEWRNKTQAQLLAEQDQYLSSIARSFEGYDSAFQSALDRLGLSRQEAEASWRSAESSVLEAARNSRSSSGVTTSSSVSNRGFQTPSNVRMDRDPSSLNTMARLVPSSTSANVDAIGGTSEGSVAVTAIEDNLTPRQKVEFSQAADAAIRYSVKNLKPVMSPVKTKDGRDTVVYGGAYDGTRLLSVILPEGDHLDIGTGTGVGHGLAHIKARNHDKELFDNSRYDSVEQAIFDTLWRWQKQGYRSGEDVVAYPSGDNITLEWRNNLTRKSPPLIVVLSRSDVNGFPLFYVKTFYPKLEPSKRYSRITLPDGMRRLTILDRYDTTGNFIDVAPVTKKGTRGTMLKEEAITLFHKQRGNVVIEQNDKNVRKLALIMAAEADAALATDDSAIGWYDEKLRAAKRVLALMHPEIATDPAMDAVMDYATAVTSNGMAVVENYKFANEQYEAMKATGRFPVKGQGTPGPSMEAAFRFYNALLDRGMDHKSIADYLSQETTVSALKNDPIIKELGINVSGSEYADQKVNVSYVIGPKIGQGFYQNLRGNFEPLTMDRWWVRMFNRLTGSPFVVVTDETVKRNIAEFKAAARGDLTDYERDALTSAVAEVMADITTDDTAIRIAKEVNRIFQRDFVKAGKDARPVKSALFLAADRLAKNTTKTVEEAPRGAKERKYMREVAERAKDMLNAELRKEGRNQLLTTADFQALMWYAEKRLWDSLGVRKGKGDDNDYVDGAIELLRSKGFDDGQITQALPAAERHRIDPVRYPRDQIGTVRGPTDGESATEASLRYSRRETKGAGDRDGRGGVSVRGLAPLEGAPKVRGASGPDPRLIRVAEDYARSIGIDLKRQAEYVEVDEERAARIAAAYDAMPHAPQDPKVKEAYDDLIAQTIAQYEALTNAGYKFWFIDPEDTTSGYADSPWNAMRDLRQNQSMGVFPTEGGFGSGATDLDVNNNPLLLDTGFQWPFGGPDGQLKPVLANDLFRAVHDAFGHGIEGSGFRAQGEENAWQAHIRLFTGPAQGAITSETRGQNSWLNYGPYGERNRDAKVEDTVFADQKTGLMPEWTWQEGRAGDMSYGGSNPMYSMMSVRSAINGQTARQIAASQETLMYARSSDVLAKVLNLGGRGLAKDQSRKVADGILRRFQDSMLPVGRMVQELSQAGLTISDMMDPYLREELMHGVVGSRIEQNQKKLYEPMLEAVKSLNVTTAEIDRLKKVSDIASGDRGYVSYALEDAASVRVALADAYLYAKHAKERNKYIREVRDQTNVAGSGMTDKEADAILDWFNSLQGVNRLAVENMTKSMRALVADTNATRLGAGLISQEMIDTGTNWRFYVPLRGIYDPDGELTEQGEFAGPPGTPRLGAKGREDRRALGRYGYASDILANTFTQNQNAILRAERNRVGQSFLNLLRADPSKTGKYARILDRRPTRRGVSASGKVVDIVDFTAGDRPDMLVVKEGGEEVFVQFYDPRLAGAMNGKNGSSATSGNILIKAMSKVNRYLASINTSYNPEFMITNMFRDLQTAGVNVNQYEKDGITSDVLGGVRGALAGIRRSIRDKDDSSEWSKLYRDFVAAGGQNATNQFNSLAEEVENIQNLIGDIAESGKRGNWNKVKRSFVGQQVGSLLHLIEDYNTVVENGVRVATYKALLDRGFTRQRAAQAARNVTVNFAKGGDYRQFMNAFYLFYNASIQGTFAMINAAVRSSKVRKLWGAVMVAGVLQDQLNAMLSPDDDDGEKVYDKIPSYILEHNFILPDPFGLTERSYIAIPMPYGLNMAHNAGRAMSRAARGGYDAEEATTTIFGTAIDALNPIGGLESFANFVAPTVADPFIDLIENEDFANKPIFKEGLPFDRTPAPDSQMFWSTTSPSAIWISNNLNELTGGNAVRQGLVDVSPDVIEFWYDFLTGGVGRFIQRSAELPFNVYEDGLSDDLVRNIPVVRKAIGSVSEREDMGEYMERASRVLMAGEELKQARESGDMQWAAETVQTYQTELRMLGQVKAFESALRKISKQMNQVEENTRIPDAQKKLIMDALDQRKQTILSNANKLLRNL